MQLFNTEHLYLCRCKLPVTRPQTWTGILTLEALTFQDRYPGIVSSMQSGTAVDLCSKKYSSGELALCACIDLLFTRYLSYLPGLYSCLLFACPSYTFAFPSWILWYQVIRNTSSTLPCFQCCVWSMYIYHEDWTEVWDDPAVLSHLGVFSFPSLFICKLSRTGPLEQFQWICCYLLTRLPYTEWHHIDRVIEVK